MIAVTLIRIHVLVTLYLISIRIKSMVTKVRRSNLELHGDGCLSATEEISSQS
jgi:hypothetical protein